ncbi:sigma-54-dependent Fis family transcriptional regulator [Alteromonas sp. ASW11-130]|uniref:sigma-54-dependent Fis family transcriptional regulator n=1 Tax=Alteromonas sp. ASW11-130 TaxID=3015775 RepID=UPI0022419A12|nr:sigma 54-interacting transcriptional regulator [Alteromonas sp. ASW11-130]MCW8092788.1 sigma 54-interacting transcriptional regulator [Alteromonas sp. ASW11-130]
MTELDNPLVALNDVLDVTQAIARERELTKQLSIIAQAARKMASAEACCVYLLDKTHRFLVPATRIGELIDHSKINLANISVTNIKATDLVEIVVYCAITGQLVNVENIYKYTGFNFQEFYLNDQITGLRTQSLLALPLADREGGCAGVLTLFNHKLHEKDGIKGFPLDLENLMRGVAAIAAISISNSLLFNEKQLLLKQQEELNASLIVENQQLKGRIYKTLQLDKIIGRGPAMEKVFGLIDKVASSTATIFLTGETGTGKELFAATIHENSPVREGKFVAQNCAAFPPDLLESEMFGYKKGAFSGANTDKKGLVEEAHLGTLFLDEIGEMPLPLQSKVLRVLQEGEVRPLGSNQTIKVQVRIIAATNRSLVDMVKEGTFREDLYYRLNVFPIALPSLRERKHDIPALTHYFIDKYAKQYGKKIKQLEPKVLDTFQTYSFPGNVRELQNIVERAVILMGEGNVFSYDILPQELKEKVEPGGEGDAITMNSSSLKDMVGHYEATVIKSKLKENHGNQSFTARQLGVSRRALVDKISRYNLRG